jgi:hypothetical protein
MANTFDRTDFSENQQGIFEVGYDNTEVGHITVTSQLEAVTTWFHVEPHFEEDELDSDVDIIGEDLTIDDANLEKFAKFLIDAGNFLLERHRLKVQYQQEMAAKVAKPRTNRFAEA